MPPPASPAWLLLMVLLLTVNVQGVLTMFSIEMPPPSAVATLSVTTMLFSVRLALPWSRMPPPVPAGPSVRGVGDAVLMVKPCKRHGELGVGLAGSKLGLMSKTRSRWLPSTVTGPPLVFTIVRSPPLGRMAKAPAALSCLVLRAGQGDLVGAGHGQVDGVAARRGVGLLDGGAQGDDAGRRVEDVGHAVDAEDGRDDAVLQQLQREAGPAVPGRGGKPPASVRPLGS